MIRRFKVGDRVRDVTLPKPHTGTVTKIGLTRTYTDHEGDFAIQLRWDDGSGGEGSAFWPEDDFELVEPAVVVKKGFAKWVASHD